MTHHRSEEGKARRRARRVLKRKFNIEYGRVNQKARSTEPRSVKCNGRFVEETTGFQAIFVKNVWPKVSMAQLSTFLQSYPGAWQYKVDKKRGPKYFFITGRWCAQGHFRPDIDKTYLAGRAGKLDVPEGFPEINEFVRQWGVTASALLRKFRPDLVPALDLLPEAEKIFGDFPLFMAAKGVAKMHTDINDVVSVLFVMKSEADCGGGLEIGGSNLVFDWEVGDVIILDSADLVHGTRDYLEDINSRIVGIFILHKSMLHISNIEIP